MITISRVQARRVRAVIRRALGLTARGPAPPVVLRQGPDGLRVRAMNATAAAECRLRGGAAAAELGVPFEFLSDCEGGRDEPVALNAEPDGTVVARWANRGVPQERRYAPPQSPAVPFPDCPARLARNGPELLAALRDAAQTADRTSTRYALDCLQLRGRQGTVAATDSRQLLVQSGFRFDWDGELLVPRNAVFGCGELPRGEPVFVGRDEERLVLRVGDWTLWLALLGEGRFPRVDDIVGRPEAARTTVRFSDADAEFLGRTLGELPGGEEVDAPVTLDLNGSVAVRARAADRPQPTELVLTGSTRTGDQLRLCTNRSHLERAVRLGFRTLHVFDGEAPALCRDDRRSYVWAVLSADGAIPPGEGAVRIESSPVSRPSPPPKPERRTPTVTSTNSTSNGRNGHPGGQRPPDESNSEPRPPATLDEILRRAEAVRESLREAHGHVGLLIAGLRQHRKQSRLVRSTLASLKQLQAIDA